MSTVKPLGAYSPIRIIPLAGVKLVFVSGLTAGADAPEDTAAQAEVIFERMRELLGEAGGDLQHVVKITTFLTDMRDYDRYNGVRNRVFAHVQSAPASATVGTSGLVRDACRIEIEAVAIVPAA
jgi:2-iminobutanoate/2-iminopropanoate deaminase